jgi:hypothetical protein
VESYFDDVRYRDIIPVSALALKPVFAVAGYFTLYFSAI